MSTADLKNLVERLEKVTDRLEKCGTGGGSSAASGAAGEESASVQAYDAFANPRIAAYKEASAKFGGVIAEHAELAVAAFDQLRALLVQAASCKKPAASDLPAILGPLSSAMQAVNAFRDARRGHEHFDHLSTISEGIGALGWVSVAPTPGPFCVQMRGGSEFYSNKLLRLYKGKDANGEAWIAAFNGYLKDFEPFIKEFHRTGLEWTGSETAKAGAAPKPAASKPAPKPAAASAKPKKAALGANLFAELNKGGAITSGLKKVERSQMTHKNPELRNKQPIKVAGSAKPKPKRSRGLPSGSPTFELQGNKWVVEFQDGNKNIVIDNAEIKHSVYIYGCYDTTIQVKCKVNQITVDLCKKVSVVCEDVVSGVAVVNASSANVQILGKCPSCAVEKVSGANVYVSDKCLDIEIVTSKSDSVNVSVPTKDGEFTEHAIPEQFVTKIGEDRSLSTDQVRHE